MIKPKFYSHKCPKCKRETIHRLSKINRDRGIKIACICCGTETKRHIKLKNLVEVEI